MTTPNRFAPGTFTPDPRPAAVSKMLTAQFGLELRLLLRNGEQLILEQPRSLVLRSFCMNHLIHHRGQLSVYLRLLNAPVPGMYGPSADEMEAMAAAQN